jgi:hypothetical protein
MEKIVANKELHSAFSLCPIVRVKIKKDGTGMACSVHKEINKRRLNLRKLSKSAAIKIYKFVIHLFQQQVKINFCQ